MSLSVEEQLEKAAKTKAAQQKIGGEPEHIKATFKGTYYQSLGQDTKVQNFEKEIKVPITWLMDENFSPVGLFVTFYAKRLFKEDPNYQSVAVAQLAKCSKLPDKFFTSASFAHRMHWTADYADLLSIAQNLRTQYQVQNDDGLLGPVNYVTIRPELYVGADELRTAIIRCQEEPRAFEREQMKHAASKTLSLKNMEADLAALGYE